ncbi:chorismate mutase [Sporolactobacillus pectinivorans]|uniref:chorismate mutase n=1 Tax=Sporolactobacillus pectinivorans TaxID=1591408 RepID=UPI000C266459|nr:chorismate mutase [Sporolactobacillus pectinivorans]
MTDQKLKELRRQIDRTDMELVTLLNQRARIVQKIGEEKRKFGIDQLDPDREKNVLAGIKAANKGPFPTDELIFLFRQLFRISIEIEKNDHRE